MRKIFALMAVCVMTLTANAQDAVGTLSLKPMVGMTIANVVGEDADGTDPKLGLIAGGELIYQASEIFALSGGLLYSMQGCAGDGGLKMKLDYVNVPLMGNLYVAKGLALKAGLQLGILTKAKASMKEGGVSADVDVKDAMNSLDLSIPIGISYDINNCLTKLREQFISANADALFAEFDIEHDDSWSDDDIYIALDEAMIDDDCSMNYDWMVKEFPQYLDDDFSGKESVFDVRC